MGTVGIALSHKDSGGPIEILLDVTVLGERILHPMLQFCCANTTGGWSFMWSWIPKSRLQITSDNLCRCNSSREFCRLTLIQAEDRSTHQSTVLKQIIDSECPHSPRSEGQGHSPFSGQDAVFKLRNYLRHLLYLPHCADHRRAHAQARPAN